MIYHPFAHGGTHEREPGRVEIGGAWRGSGTGSSLKMRFMFHRKTGKGKRGKLGRAWRDWEISFKIKVKKKKSFALGKSTDTKGGEALVLGESLLCRGGGKAWGGGQPQKGKKLVSII